MSRQLPFFRPGGTMDPGAPSYIEREADQELLEALIAREYVYLLDSRQKGKSSLVARTIVRLRENGIETLKLDLQRIGANVTPEQWYAGMLASIGHESGLTDALFSYWASHQAVGPLARWIGAIRDVILKEVTCPIVLFIDEVDFVRALPFSTDEFFAAIRDCCNRRSEEEGFERLTFCLVGVATPGQLIRNPDITPFNVGRRVDLSDFSEADTKPFATAFQEAGRPGALLLRRIHYWVAGHPYLTQLLCSRLVARPDIATNRGVDELVTEILFAAEARQTEPNLADVERRLLAPDLPALSTEEGRSQILELHGLLLHRKSIKSSSENPVLAALCLSGVAVEDRTGIRLRNRVYGRVFDERWRRNNVPEAEARRLRRAARLAIMRTAGIAGVVLIAMSSLAFGMWRLSGQRQQALQSLSLRGKQLASTANEKERALSALEMRNKEISRVSGERARVLSSLERQNEALRRVTRERERAIADLESRSNELDYSNYVGQMASIRHEVPVNNWRRMSEIIERSAANPNRNWEWGHIAKVVAFGTQEEKFPKWSVLEPQPKGDPLVVTPDGAFSIEHSPARRVETFQSAQPIYPAYRRGDFRIHGVELPRGHEIYLAGTQRRLMPSKNYSQVMDVDPDRRRYLLARDETLETVELRTLDDDRLITAYKGPNHTDAARFLANGTVLSIHTTKTEGLGEVRRWNAKGETLDSAPSDQQYAQGIALSPDKKMYAAWGFNNKVEVRWAEGHRKISALADHSKIVTALAFSRDGSRIITGSEDGVVSIFDVKTGVREAKHVGHKHPVRSVSFVESDGGVASIDGNGVLRMWPRVSDSGLEDFKEFTKHPLGAAFDPIGQRLISMDFEGNMVSRSLLSGSVVRRTLKDPKGANCVANLRDGSDIFVGRPNGRVERYSAARLALVSTAEVFEAPVTTLEVLPGGERLFAGSKTNKYALLDASSLNVLARIEPRQLRKAVDPQGVEIEDKIAYDQESPQVALFLGRVGKIQVFSTLDGKLVREWTPSGTVLNFAFIGAGRKLVASLAAAWYVNNGRTLVYDVRSGRQVFEIMHPGKTMRLFEYAPTTGILAAGTSDRQYSERSVHLYNVQNMRKLAEVATDPFIFRCSFSPDGKRLLTTSEGFSMRLWDSRTGDEMFKLPKNGLARFTADGHNIVQVAGGGWVRLWKSMPWK